MTWHPFDMHATIVLGGQGRLVVPARVREELGLKAGDELVLRTEEGRIVLEHRRTAGKRLRGLFASPQTQGAVDELLEERRQEASGE